MSRLARCTGKPHLWRRFFKPYQSSRWLHSQEKSTEKPKRELTEKYLAEKKLEKFEAGATVHGFLVEDVERIDVFDLIALRLTHLRTGAQCLHLARDDSNNVFAVGFRTTPSDSTGVPHILEHMALCGSAKYPCRDPFFKMLRRSLATFMNAMTGFDYTVYPFSTVNEKDFRNLRSVYLDAVFRPNLRELDFKQEGWRLEHQNPDDRTSPIVLKGVVFNEMKGVFSENENLFQYRFFNDILPSHTYGVCSGGNPLVIPTLNYEDLVNFHKTYYHPSNSRFYSYGSLALEEHLEYINENYLTSSERLDSSMSRVPAEKRWTEPRYSRIECGPNPLNPEASRCGSIAIGYLCNDITAIQESLDLSIAADLLLGGPKSPFYRALIESALGTSFGPLTGYHAFTKDVAFALSLTGVRPETFRQVEAAFDRTMAEVAEEGFTQQQISAAVHSVELRMKHIPRNFGLQLLYGLNSRWNHDADIIHSLKVNELLDTFEGLLRRNPRYIQELLERYFLKNRHKLVATMLPKEEYPAETMRAEQELLESKVRGLSAEELSKIYLDGQVLRAEQEREDDSELLPILEIDDVEPPTYAGGPAMSASLAGVPVNLYQAGTNGLCYYRALIDTSRLPEDLKDLIPLFGNAVTQMGTENYDYRRFTEMVQLKTDGLEFSPHVSTDKTDLLRYEEALLTSSRCLDRNLPDMWHLWAELFNNVTLQDVNRFETIVRSYTADLVEGIADAGHSYAMQSAGSLVSPSYRLKERFSGLRHIKRMKRLAQERDFTGTLAKIQDIARRVLNKGQMRSSMNAAARSREEIFDSMRQFYEALKPAPGPPAATPRPDEPPPPPPPPKADSPSAVHHVFPYSVNYASKAVLTVPYNHPEYPSLRLLAPLVSSLYLHPEIREKGGAYGSGAKLSPSGVFFFYSYRDPNSTRTFDIFDKTHDFLRKHTLSDSDLHQAKLQVLQQFSAPITPSNRGMEDFLYGLTDEMRAKLVENVKSTTKDCLMHVAEKYLQPANENQRVGRAFIGPASAEFLEKRPESWTVERGEQDD